MKIDASKPLELTKEEAMALIKQELVHGSDGKIIRANNKYLIKLYHEQVKKLLGDINSDLLEKNDDSNIKLYKMRSALNRINSFEELFIRHKSEVDGGIIRVRSSEVIKEAQNRQYKIKNTHLPLNAVYIDGKYSGCILLAERGFQIHKLTGILPLSFKKKIMKQILFNVKELMDNCVYHLELNNSPYTKESIYVENGSIELVGHSHVLIDPITLKPHIIDLEGKSTVYSEKPDQDLEWWVMYAICQLMIEFLLKIDFDVYRECTSDLKDLMKDIGVKLEYIDKLAECSLTFDESLDFVDSLDDIKSL